MNASTAAIQTYDLTKRFKKITAVDGVNFTVHQGEVFGFLGPNGAGPGRHYSGAAGGFVGGGVVVGAMIGVASAQIVFVESATYANNPHSVGVPGFVQVGDK